MTQEDKEYRQGRSKEKVELNEQIAIYSYSIMMIVLFVCLLYSVFIKL